MSGNFARNAAYMTDLVHTLKSLVILRYFRAKYQYMSDIVQIIVFPVLWLFITACFVREKSVYVVWRPRCTISCHE